MALKETVSGEFDASLITVSAPVTAPAVVGANLNLNRAALTHGDRAGWIPPDHGETGARHGRLRNIHRRSTRVGHRDALGGRVADRDITETQKDALLAESTPVPDPPVEVFAAPV